MARPLREKHQQSAEYSDGRSFGYEYDVNGNILEKRENLGEGTETTTYTYDAANQLVTSQVDRTTWYYMYDANGSLIEVLPESDSLKNARRYTYNVAGYLVKVESHDGKNWTVQAEMSYTGMGARLITSSAGNTTYYSLDGQLPLTIRTDDKAITILYGSGPIAEKMDVWNYVLMDGTDIPRQLTNLNGEITLSLRYNPWGKTIETIGVENFDMSYISTLVDFSTGLIYVGNGQYFDPETGRFLTRGISPNSPNPYVPWNPMGMIVGPLGLVSMLSTRKKIKHATVAGSLSFILVSCAKIVLVIVAVALVSGGCTPQNSEPIDTNNSTQNVGGPATVPAETPSPTSAPNPTPTVDPCANCTPTPTPKNWLPDLFQITHYAIVLEDDGYFSSEEGNIPFWENGQNKYYRYTYDFIVGNSEKDVNWSVYVQGTGKAKDGKYIQTDLDPSHFPPVGPGEYQVNAVYQYVDKPTPKCVEHPNNYLAEDETLAVSQQYFGSEGYRCGDQYYIEGRGDKIYTITDTGTFPEKFQLDVFAGEHTHDSFYGKYPYTGEFHRVARVQK